MGVSVTTTAADLLIAASGFTGLVTPKIDLFTALANPPSKVSVFADATVPTYTGYAGPLACAESAVYIPQGGGPSVDLADAIFNGPTSGAGVDVIGWIVWNGVTMTPVCYAVGLFDGPLSLNLPTDRVTVDETVGFVSSVTYEASN